MPRRWISVRGSKQLNNGSFEHDHTEFQIVSRTDRPSKYDPTFRAGSPSLAYRVEPQRPQSSGGLEKRKSKPMHIPDEVEARPQTSENSTPTSFGHGSGTSKTPSPDVYDMIGLAYGSPTHPPSNFYEAMDRMSPVIFDNHAFEQCGPFTEEQMQASKSRWRRFGFLFKSKPSKTPSSDPSFKKKLETSCSIYSPTAQEFLPSEVPEDSPITLHNFPAPPRASSRNQSEEIQESNTSNSQVKPSLPKLQVEIPNADMDRYTVMFGKGQASQSSMSLLERRTKILDQLRANAGYPPRGMPTLAPVSTEDPELLAAPRTVHRRQTSPTIPTFPNDSGSYSLYPRSSSEAPRERGLIALEKAREEAGNGLLINRGRIKRSMTSPACMSPIQDTFDVARPSPLRFRKNSEGKIRSPKQSTASTEHTAMWSAGTFSSPASSVPTIDDEILFDVKSFRDSQGVEGTQFEISRPTSTAVELYRTMSQNHKASAPKGSRLKNELLNELPMDVRDQVTDIVSKDIGTPDTAFDPDDSKTIDETIAAVERLASSALPRNVSPVVKVHIGQLLGPSPKAEPKKTEAKVVKHVRVISPKPSPQLVQGITARAVGQPEMRSALAAAPAPPVPVKDSKFIPVSKYAAKPGSRPARPERAKTDSPTLPSQEHIQPPASRTARAATENSPLRTTMRSKYNPNLQQASQSDESLVLGAEARNFKPTRVAHLKPIFAPSESHSRSPSSSQSSSSAAVPAIVSIPAVVQIAPAAEVSVARKVSLSRKESRRVLVTPGLTKRRREREREREKENERRVDEWDTDEEKRRTRMELKEVMGVRMFSPVLREVERGHRVGKSVNALIESV